MLNITQKDPLEEEKEAQIESEELQNEENNVNEVKVEQQIVDIKSGRSPWAYFKYTTP